MPFGNTLVHGFVQGIAALQLRGFLLAPCLENIYFVVTPWAAIEVFKLGIAPSETAYG